MAVSPADVRVIVERVCARPDVLDACARRDLGAVISALGTGGLTQGQISALTGIPQGRLSEWKTGKREPKGVTTFQKFADGVGLPPAARRALGLTPPQQPRHRDPAPPTLTLCYPDSAAQAVRNVSALWHRRPEPTPACSSAAGPTPAHGMKPRSAGWSIPAACPRTNRRAECASACPTWSGSGPPSRCSPSSMTGSAEGTRAQALIQYLQTDADRMLERPVQRCRRPRAVHRGGRGDAARRVDDL